MPVWWNWQTQHAFVVDIFHFGICDARMANIRYTKEMIQEAVNRSFTWAEACRQLGIRESTGGQSHLTKRAKEMGVEFSHFYSRSEASSLLNRSQTKDVNIFLVKSGKPIHSHSLKVRLIRAGIKKYQCEDCLGTEWRGGPIPIELHHIDGDRTNNLLENLKVLCCNCHSMTPNFSGKKRSMAK